MFGISFEHILIVGIILIVLGPKRLPEMGNSVGRAIKNFKDSIGGLHEEPKSKLTEQKPETTQASTDPKDPA
jgi:sec-independent protein translocase protein TatA